ncbi:MAG: putative rane protein [Micavibrio sp.]|nr:putative rane protein [Micavibrio sp.]
MKDPALEYRPFLDGMRAIAVLGVILFHCNVARISGGYVGVDIFFVLSGFLITGVIDTALRQQNFTFAHFYERRCRRILPALFGVCALSVISALFLLVPYDYRSFSKTLKGTSLFYSNMIFAKANGYFADPLSIRPLLHTWSLAVEEQFYLLFPPFFYGIYRAVKGNRKAIGWAVALLFLASLAANLALINTSPDKTFYILPTRAWELLTGSLVFLVLRHISLSRYTAEGMAAIGTACIAVCFVFYDRNTLFPGWAALLPCAGTALLIWSNLHGTTLPGRVLSTRPMVMIGLISYGLYLFHWPVLVFARYALDRELNAMEGLATMAVTIILSVASYRLIEMPIRSGRFLKTRKSVFLFSAFGIVAMLAVAITGMKSNGFPARFSGEVLQYAAGNGDIQDWEKRVPPLNDLNEKTVLRLGSPDTRPTFLVWGDSHAEALAPAIEARAKAAGTSGLFVEYSGCLPLIGVARLDHAPKNAPCQAVGKKVLSLLKDGHIRHVILAGRWDDIYGWEKGSIELGRPEAIISYTSRDGTQLKRGPAFAPAFRETVQTLTRLGVHIWVVEQVPPFLVDVPSALAKAVHFGRGTKSINRPYQDILNRRRPTTDTFDEYRRIKNISFLDPAVKLCPGQKLCLVADDGHALYRDSNHLSVYGSLWVMDIFDPVFRSLSATRQK